MSDITKEKIMKFRKDFADTVQSLENIYGFKIELGNIKFDSAQFTSQLKVTAKNASGTLNISPVLQERACRAIILAVRGKFPPVHQPIGTWFVNIRGENIKITDWITRNSKYPMIYTKEDGKSYKGHPTSLYSELTDSYEIGRLQSKGIW